MPSPRCRVLAVLLIVALVGAAGCGGGDEPSVASPVTTSESSTTTTVAEKQWAIDEVPPPDEITVEYVQRVMDALDQGIGDAFRRYKADGGPRLENEPMLAELYAEPELSRSRSSWGQLAGLSFDGVKEDPGNPTTVVHEIVRSSEACVLLLVGRSLREVLDASVLVDPQGKQYVALQARGPDAPPTELNPTAWQIVLDATMPDDSTPAACQ